MTVRGSLRQLGRDAGESGEGLCFDEVGEIVIVPGGGFESQPDLIPAWVFACEVGGHVFDCDEVLGGLIGSDAAFVILEGHVENPVQAVLNGPMVAHHGCEFGGVQRR